MASTSAQPNDISMTPLPTTSFAADQDMSDEQIKDSSIVGLLQQDNQNFNGQQFAAYDNNGSLMNLDDLDFEKLFE